MSVRRLPGRVLALTPGDSSSAATLEFVRRARAAVEAGLDSILVREPELSDRATLELARALREILGADGWLGIHDRIHLALAARADAVHLGFQSLTIREARVVLHDEIAIGFSAHAHDDPVAWTGADYLVFGPVYETPSKQGLLAPVGVEGLTVAVSSTAIPIWALGGIDAACVQEVERSGCRGIAVRGELLAAPDPRAAMLGFAKSSAAPLETSR